METSKESADCINTDDNEDFVVSAGDVSRLFVLFDIYICLQAGQAVLFFFM